MAEPEIKGNGRPLIDASFGAVAGTSVLLIDDDADVRQVTACSGRGRISYNGLVW